MATTLLGARIQNTVFFKEDVKSRKSAFASLKKYKKEVLGIKTQLMGLGNIKIKVDGLAKARAQIAQIKEQATKTVQAKAHKTQKKATSTQPTSGLFGPTKPPLQGGVKAKAMEQAAADAKSLEATRAKIREEKRLAKIFRLEMSPAMQKLTAEDREQEILGLKKIKNANKLGRAITEVQAKVRKMNQLERERLRIMNKQNFATKRSSASMAQLAGSAFSVFTLMQGIGAVARTGMGMQRIESTMLSVSKNTEEAQENMAFLRKESHRLGMDRLKAGRAFSKILAARGELTLPDARQLFSAVSEAGVVSGTTADEMSLQVKALSQMLGKTTVMSEELKQQLGDTMPIALQVFATAAKEAGISTSGTTKELFKLMEDGAVPASKIMPFVTKGFHDFAIKNDALTVSLAKFGKQLDIAGDDLLGFQEDLYGAGVEDGLKFLLNGFKDLMKSSKTLANVLGGVFKGAIVALALPFRLLISGMQTVAGLFGKSKTKGDMQEWVKTISKLAGVVLGLTAALLGLKAVSIVFSLIGLAVSGLTAKIALLVGGIALVVAGIKKLKEVMPEETKTNVGRTTARVLSAFGSEEATRSLIAESEAGSFTDSFTAFQAPLISALRNVAFPALAAPQPFTGQGDAQPQKLEVKVTSDIDLFTATVESLADGRITQFTT